MMNTTYSVGPPRDSKWGDCNRTACSGMFAPVMDNVRYWERAISQHDTWTPIRNSTERLYRPRLNDLSFDLDSLGE